MRKLCLVLLAIAVILTISNCFLKPANNPPVWSPIPGATVIVGDSVERDLSLYATDPDGDPLTFSKVSGPGNVVGSLYSWIDISAPPYGGRTVVVRASDGRGGQTTSSFVITVRRPPYTPSNPIPVDESENQDYPTLELSWTGGHLDGDPVTYDIYFGTSDSPPLLEEGHASTSFTVDGLESNTTYYWQIMATDGGYEVWGALWSFKTGPVYLIDDDFESYTAGTAPDLPWGNYSSSGTSSGLISNFGRDGGKALTFFDPTLPGWAKIENIGWNNFRTCVLQYDFRIAPDGAFGVRLLAFGGDEPYIFVGDRGPGWGLYAVNGIFDFELLAPLIPDVWYTVRVEFSFTERYYNVYLNGTYIGSQEITDPETGYNVGIQVIVFGDESCDWVDIDNISLAVYDTGYMAASVASVMDKGSDHLCCSVSFSGTK